MDGRIDPGWIAMLSLHLAVLRSLAAGFRVSRNLVLENLALRHQLLVLNRKIKSPPLRNSDRLFWAALSVMWSRWMKVAWYKKNGFAEQLVTSSDKPDGGIDGQLIEQIARQRILESGCRSGRSTISEQVGRNAMILAGFAVTGL